MYEEDASPGASPSEGGEPLAIALALRDNKKLSRKGGDDDSAGGTDVDVDVDRVRVGVVAVDVRTGKVVHDAFVERSGQRRELDTRLRHLK